MEKIFEERSVSKVVLDTSNMIFSELFEMYQNGNFLEDTEIIFDDQRKKMGEITAYHIDLDISDKPVFGNVNNVFLKLYSFDDGNRLLSKFVMSRYSSFDASRGKVYVVGVLLNGIVQKSVLNTLTHELHHAYQFSLGKQEKYVNMYHVARNMIEQNDSKMSVEIGRMCYMLHPCEIDAQIQELYQYVTTQEKATVANSKLSKNRIHLDRVFNDFLSLDVDEKAKLIQPYGVTVNFFTKWVGKMLRYLDVRINRVSELVKREKKISECKCTIASNLLWEMDERGFDVDNFVKNGNLIIFG